MTWTLTADTDLVVLGIHHDNTPTRGATLCTFADHHPGTDQAVHCTDSDYRMLNMLIDGSQFNGETGEPCTTSEKESWFGRSLGTNDHLQFREYPCTTDNIPLEAGEDIVLTFDTINGANDVRLDVTFVVMGSATLT